MVESLDFEAPLVVIQKEIETLTGYPDEVGKEREIKRLKDKLDKMREEIFAGLTPWQKVQVARHPQRPYLLDFIKLIFDDFMEIHGDRRFADDPAIVAGMAMVPRAAGHDRGTSKGA